ncbi:MAG TPA: hypothetical protein VF282_01360, partial [Bacillota bacterium]
MSDTPPAGAASPAPAGPATPAPAGPATPPQPPVEQRAARGESGHPTSTPVRRRRLPAGWGAWLLVLVVAVMHLAAAGQSVGTGAVVPAIDDLRGEDI